MCVRLAMPALSHEHCCPVFTELIVKHRSVVFEDSAAVSAAGADATTGGEEEGSDGSDEDEGEEGGDDEEADADVAAKALTDL